MRLNTLTQVKPVVNEAILNELKHLDLSGKVTFENSKASGVGAFSEVFQGRLRQDPSGELAVAVKRLRFHITSTDCTKLFEQEICVWARLRHENVLPLLGFAFCVETCYPVLISQWMPFGTLWSYVTANQQLKTLSIQSLAWDVAKGLAYLHEKNVVHSDIKSDNIVVSPQEVAMICDFGCSRMEAASRSLVEITSTTKGTYPFWAPELLDIEKSGKHSKETDVWAFGMTVYEIFHRKRPYSDGNQMQVMIKISRGVLPTFEGSEVIDASIYLTASDLCLMCWRESSERPTMDAILSHPLFTPLQSQDTRYSNTLTMPDLLPRTARDGPRALVDVAGNSVNSSPAGDDGKPMFVYTTVGYDIDDDSSVRGSEEEPSRELSPETSFSSDPEYQERTPQTYDDDHISASACNDSEEEIDVDESHSESGWQECPSGFHLTSAAEDQESKPSHTVEDGSEDEDAPTSVLDIPEERAPMSAADYVAAAAARHAGEDGHSVVSLHSDSEPQECNSEDDRVRIPLEDFDEEMMPSDFQPPAPDTYEEQEHQEDISDDDHMPASDETSAEEMFQTNLKSSEAVAEPEERSMDDGNQGGNSYWADDAYSDGGADDYYEFDYYDEHDYDSDRGWD